MASASAVVNLVLKCKEHAVVAIRTSIHTVAAFLMELLLHQERSPITKNVNGIWRNQIGELGVHQLTRKGLRFCRFLATSIAFMFYTYAAVVGFPDKVKENQLWIAVFIDASIFVINLSTMVVSLKDRGLCLTLKECVDVFGFAIAFAIAIVRLVDYQNDKEHVVAVLTSVHTVAACLSRLIVADGADGDGVAKTSPMHHEERLFQNEIQQVSIEIPPLKQIVEMPIKLPNTIRSPPLPPRGSGYLHNVY